MTKYLAAIGVIALGAVVLFFSREREGVAAVDGRDSPPVREAAPTLLTDPVSHVFERSGLEVAPGGNKVRVRVLRFPDRESLRSVPVLVRGEALAPTWLATDDRGELGIPADLVGETLFLSVSGFVEAPVRLSSAPDREVVLRPEAGLYGVALAETGRPAAGAEVRLLAQRRFFNFQDGPDGEAPGLRVTRWTALVAMARTNDEGLYFLDTRDCDARLVHLEATLGSRLGSRGPVAVGGHLVRAPDLLLAPEETLPVSVTDESGHPLEGIGILVGAADRPISEGRFKRTNSSGLARFSRLNKPFRIRVSRQVARLLEIEVDGVRAEVGSDLPSVAQSVEIVVRSARSVFQVQVFDAVTGEAVVDAFVRVEFREDGESLGGGDAVTAADGVAQFRPARLDDRGLCRAEVQVVAGGYERAALQVDMEGTSRVSERVHLLPKAGKTSLRGRLTRRGEPVAGRQVELYLRYESASAAARSNELKTRSDEEGGFGFTWNRGALERSVLLVSRDLDKLEFGYFGPMPEPHSGVEDVALELGPMVRVPALLRGAVKDAEYRYFVTVRDPGSALEALTYSQSLRAPSGGDCGVTLLLPELPCRVSVGLRDPDSGASVDFDPAQPGPMVFWVESLAAEVSGSVIGLDAVTQREACVVWASRGSARSRLAVACPEGRFSLPSVPVGSGTLWLVDAKAQRTLASAAVELSPRGAMVDLLAGVFAEVEGQGGRR